MARTVKDAKLDSAAAREKLKARGKPYYRDLAQGLHIGYRKNKSGGVWVARMYAGDQAYKVVSIGPADDRLKADGVSVFDFRQAQEAARLVRDRQIVPVQSENIVTVRDAVTKYIAKRDKREIGRRGKEVRSDANQRLTRHVLGQPARGKGKDIAPAALADVALSDLSEDALADWRAGLQGDLKETTKRRLVADLKAALNDHRKLLPTTLDIRAALKSDIAEDSAEPVARDNQILDAAQVRRIVAAAQEVDAEQDWGGDLFRLVSLLANTGARFSQIARMKVRDVQVDRVRLMVPSSRKGKGKSGHEPVVVDPAVIELLLPVVVGRDGDAPLLERTRLRQLTGGVDRWVPGERGPWQKASEFDRAWKVIRERSGMPDVIPYALRHSSIVRGLKANLNIRHVAALHDTSVVMIERHYGRYISDGLEDMARAAIVPLMPSTGEGGKVLQLATR